MQTAAIYIKTDPKVKAQAQKVAKELGLSLSSLLNGWLRKLIKTKTFTFSVEDEIPNGYFKRTLAKARKNWKERKGSPIFTNIEDDLKWLEKQGI
ncbi:type II toxin-antitoxin system RelB/DinJ family antitoxin [Candidatus Daviesbacteria bacterium]|nr:type II toxin-antitoxin system RelB/DinJ family antitoxin [Candidatus Daviesbacteria bacterium]